MIKKDTENMKRSVCIVCGQTVQEGRRICDCCRDSLALCDVENYVARKTANKNYRGDGLNAFK